MSAYVDEERVVYEASNEDRKDDVLGNISSHINKGGEPPTATMEAEKRIRREIANSNERRRMQSINNGFQSLRSLLPHHEGEKLSKAAILQQTAEYIYSLEQEKTRLLSQNCQLKRLVNQQDSGGGLNAGCGELPPKKRKTELILPSLSAESSDEGLGSMSPEPVGLITVSVSNSLATAANIVNNNNNIGESVVELRRLLDRERGMRLVLEEQVRQFETQIYQQQSGGAQLYHVEGTEELALQLVTADNLPPVGHTQTVVCSPPNSRSPSPEPQERLPSVLEAAIKAEPKVEVERLPSPSPSHEDTTPSRLYVSNTSRQNLETIVEAIRHLEGDHMFGDEPTPVATATAVAVVQQQQQQQQQQQEVPLALTTKTPPRTVNANLMEFSAALVQQSQQSRPGVIVVKQAS